MELCQSVALLSNEKRMNAEKWQKINDLFHATLDVGAEERAELMNAEPDDSVRTEVQKLLVAHESSGNFIAEPASPNLVNIISNGSGTSPKSTINTGDRIGRYNVIEQIGRGGMGEVYLCRDADLNRDVAIKVLPPEFTNDAERIKRFRREARSASALNHPNILTIYEIGESDGLQFMVSEFVAGKTLTEHLSVEKPSTLDALKIAEQICSALAAAHEAGIVHRDIKPDNVMVRGDGLVKVLDFGLAKATTTSVSQTENATLLKSNSFDSGASNTVPGMVMGTPDHMSPEQARGKAVDAQSDIFSLGVVMYQMLTGVKPFGGETISDTIAEVLTKEPRPVREIDPSITSEIESIVNRALKKDKAERFASSRVMLSEISSSIDHLKTGGGTAQMPENATVISDRPKAPLSNTARPFKFAVASLALILVAIGGYFGYGYFFAAKQIRSIAVLPFENDSDNKDVEYISDGMTDTLIRGLSQLPDLDVKARSSVYRYKGKAPDIRAIADELGAQAVLYGRFTQRGDNIGLSLELVDAATLGVLWTEQYSRPVASLAAMQGEVAKDVTVNLRFKLSREDQTRLATSGTENSEAFRSYLRGRYMLTHGTSQSQMESLRYFSEAVDADPKFALGYAGLADAYAILGTVFRASIPTDEAMPKAKAAAESAIALDPQLSEAYVSLAWVKFRFDWDWAGAESDFRKAIELNKNNAQAYQWYGELLSALGRDDEAIQQLTRAQSIEPYSAIITWNLGKAFVSARKFDQAIPQLKKSIDLDNGLARGYGVLAEAYFYKGQEKEAFDAAMSAAAISKYDPARMEELTKIFKDKGFGAMRAKEFEPDESQPWRNSPYNKVRYYAQLKDKENTLNWLEESYKQRIGAMAAVRSEVYLDFVRGEPRFREILRKMNLPE